MKKEYNKNIIVALVDNNGVMFTEKQGVFSPVESIEEHIERITYMSDNNHIYMDDIAFRAYGEKPLRDKFTRVFTHKKVFSKNVSTKFRIHHIDELHTIVSDKEQYESDKKIFFIGGADFLFYVSRYCDTVLKTEIENFGINQDDFDTVYKFPSMLDNNLKQIREVKSFTYDDNVLFNNKIDRSKVTEEVYKVLPNGMKMIDTSLKNISNEEHRKLILYKDYKQFNNIHTFASFREMMLSKEYSTEKNKNTIVNV